ncbi:MAG: sigma-70 family RNA polymerase sigma factor, partial [Chitinophagaceae bacterium]
KSYAEAEDILQDIFTQLWSGRKNLGQIASFDDYLFITTRNAIRKSLLKKEKQQKLLDRAVAELQPQTFELEGVKDIEKMVNAALLQLPEQQRAIYKMSRQEGLTHEQIGSRLGLSPKTIANNLTLTLNQIRVFLGRQGYLLGAAWLFFNFL